MSVFLKVMLAVDIVLFLAVIILPLIRFKRSTKDVVAVEPVVEEVPAVEEAPAVEEVVEEVSAVEEAPVVEEVVAETPAVVEEELVVGDIGERARRIPFNEKMLFAEKKLQGYYNAIYNEFISYRKINPRVSSKGVSYRLGRVLVAKLTIRGKTLRFHLALPMDAVDEKIYFQRDFSDTKSYVEVPFTVKVRSDRGLKNALNLINVLAGKHSIEKKTRFTEVDAIEMLKTIKR